MSKIVSVSLPPETRDALDAEAKRQRRSRSWVVREAVAEYVAQRRDAAFAAAREHTRHADLSLTAEERVHLCDDLWRELTFGAETPRGDARSFDTFDQYHAWRREHRRRGR
jgi:predicted transcriptional regulator